MRLVNAVLPRPEATSHQANQSYDERDPSANITHIGSDYSF